MEAKRAKVGAGLWTRGILLGAAILVAGALLCPAAGAAQGDAKKIVMDGSTTVGPIAKAFAEYFKKHHGVNVTVSESGSGNGAKGILNGTCDIGNMSRFMKDNEFKACVDKGVFPVAHVVALDGLPIIVHPSNPVKNLSIQQIHDIYAGKISNWKDLGGPDKEIVIISRDTNSGTYETFEKLVMKKDKITGKAEYVGSNGQMRARVQATPAAIGYAGLGFLDRTIKALTVNGIEATPKTVSTGVYPIARPLFMFTNGYPKMGSYVYQMVTLHLTEDGEKMVNEIGYVPVTSYED
jgi:phosphate transport system substrate-binding protein